MKRVLHILPHLSTGGCPQFALDLIKKTFDTTECYAVEYAFIAPDFVVQRNKLIDFLPEDRFMSLGSNKHDLIDYIDQIKPDVIHLQEFPEYFMDDEVTKKIYKNDRDYVIIETSHDSSFNPSTKRFFADHLALISQWQIDKFKSFDIPITLLESDVEQYPKTDRNEGLLTLGLDPSKKHILNVGLWTSRKNQGEIVEYAKKLEKSHPEVQFHFVGNQAMNFQHYWEPIMRDLPSNVKVWGERNDVHNFYSCMDLFLFTSRGLHGDMETSPLVIREALGHGMPILIYNLHVYLDQYKKYNSIDYLDFDDLDKNLQLIINKLPIEKPDSNMKNMFRAEYAKEENKIFLYYQEVERKEVSISVVDIDSKHAFYAYDAAFDNYSSCWILPMPVECLNRYNKSGYFRGYEISIYERNRVELIEKHICWYNENAPYFERVMFEANPWNLTWINYTEMFVEDFYNPLQMDIKGICLDIGANDGLYTEYLLHHGAEKVYAVECDPRSVAWLNKRYNSNPKVVVVDKAMYKENIHGMKLAFDDATSTTSSLIDKDHPSHNESFLKKHFLVDSWDYKTLLAKMNIQKVDFFKIDIEGAEYDVFRGMTDEELSQIEGYMVELHWNDGKVYEITDRLERLGFEIEFRRHTLDNALVPKEEWKDYLLATFYARKKKSNEPLGLNEIQDVEWQDVPKTDTFKVHLSHLTTSLKTPVEIESLTNIGQDLFKFMQADPRFHVTASVFINDPYTDIPPRENCARPNAVSMRAFPNGINEFGETALTPAHYGCYKAFKDAVVQWTGDKDIEILFEGDAFIKDIPDFVEKLYQVLTDIKSGHLDVQYISFGGIYHLETGEELSPETEYSGFSWARISNHVPFCQCVMIPKGYQANMKEAFENEPWDVADLFFMNHFRANPHLKQLVTNNQVVVQLDGFSLIDKKVKQYLNK